MIQTIYTKRVTGEASHNLHFSMFWGAADSSCTTWYGFNLAYASK